MGARMLCLDVGGVQFTTSLESIHNGGPRSRLSEICEAHPSSEKIFIDRDPDLFKYILAYLREPSMPEHCVPQSIMERKRLLQEAKYFRLRVLVEVLQSSLTKPAAQPRNDFVVVTCERVLTLLDGNAVAGYYAVGGKVESPARWFSGFSVETFTQSFQERVAACIKYHCVNRGLKLISSESSTAICPSEEGPPGSQKLTFVHNITYLFGPPSL